MNMSIQMIRTILMVPVALGTVPEIQFGMGITVSSADLALMSRRCLCGTVGNAAGAGSSSDLRLGASEINGRLSPSFKGKAGKKQEQDQRQRGRHGHEDHDPGIAVDPVGKGRNDIHRVH